MSCGSQFVFQIGGSGVMGLSLRDENGNPIDDTSLTALPQIKWMTLNSVGVDETNAAYNIQVQQVQDDTPSAITGEYEILMDPSAFTAGDVIRIGVCAEVNGTTLNTVKEVLIKDENAARPTIC